MTFHENNRIHERIMFRDGLIHGQVQVKTDKGIITKDTHYTKGINYYPISKAFMKSGLQKVLKTKPKKGDLKHASSKNIKAVQLLNAYRFICGVPADVELKDEYSEYAAAGAALCAKINRLDHTPKNPGLPEEEYKKGYHGTSHSNLSMGTAMELTPSAYMDDSDKSNISRVGHRRWCINPAMKYSGFGAKGKYSAMYSFDRARPSAFEYNFISFPARGYMPSKYFKASYAWSLSLNPSKYSKPNKASIKVHIYSMGKSSTLPFKTTGKEPLKLNYFNVNLDGIGIPNCIIFRPDKISTKRGSKYWVEILGVKGRDGKSAKVEYVVEFS